jgi:hypothetical protein
MLILKKLSVTLFLELWLILSAKTNKTKRKIPFEVGPCG